MVFILCYKNQVNAVKIATGERIAQGCQGAVQLRKKHAFVFLCQRFRQYFAVIRALVTMAGGTG